MNFSALSFIEETEEGGEFFTSIRTMKNLVNYMFRRSSHQEANHQGQTCPEKRAA